MTYLVGWKHRGAAFLCADSMVTNPPEGKIESLSSFGEMHVDDGKRRVEEAAIKIVNLGSVAIGVAGEATKGMSIVRDVASLLVRGGGAIKPREAFLRAVDRSSERARGVQLLAVVAEKDGAALLFYRGSGPVEEVLEGQSAHGGNVGPHNKEYADLVTATLQMLSPSSFGAEELLVCMLGYIQGMCTQHALVEKYGIGGAFIGLYADSEKIHWQPDMLYVVSAQPKWLKGDPPDFIATVIRDNVAIINSTFLTLTRLFANDINVSLETFHKVRQTWAPDGNYARIKDGPFDYIDIIDTQTWSLAVLQMARQMESRDVRLRVRRITEWARGVALDMTNEFRKGLISVPIRPRVDPGKILIAHGTFVFREYKPPERPWPPVPQEMLIHRDDVPEPPWLRGRLGD